MTPAEQDAATFTGRLWAAIRAAGGPHAPGHACRHFLRAYDTAWLTSLPLPDEASRPPVQPVALLDDRHAEFERHTDPATLAAAYASHPRTQVLEDIAASQAGTWYWLTALHLTRLSRSDPHVTCSVSTSRNGDQTFGAHRDTWYGAVVQIDGAKDWQIGDGLLAGTPAQVRKIITRAGDVLLMPKYLPHIVTTPPSPGHSVHLAFAICRDRPNRVPVTTARLPERWCGRCCRTRHDTSPDQGLQDRAPGTLGRLLMALSPTSKGAGQ